MSVSEHVSPLCWRYGSEGMREIFSEKNKLALSLSVEAALAEAEAEYGVIPREAAEEIGTKAITRYVTLEAVWEREQQMGHDVMAMVELLTAACKGDAGRYVHYGATSYDVEDNRLSMQINQALGIIRQRIAAFGRALRERAEQYKSACNWKDAWTVGRTSYIWIQACKIFI
jgi:adenylosuccinate lyase